MGEGNDDMPCTQSQKKLLAQPLVKSVRNGETWYLVDAGWMKKLKAYIGMADSSMNSPHLPDPPGPVDNSPLIDESTQELKKNLSDHLDYILLPEEGWNYLVSWYGMVDGQLPIARKAIKSGPYSDHCVVEVYPTEIKCVLNNDVETEKRLIVSRTEVLGDVIEKLKVLYELDKDSSVRLWFLNYDSPSPLPLDKTVQESGVSDQPHVVLETQLPNGNWTIGRPKNAVMEATQNVNAYPSTSNSTSGTSNLLLNRSKQSVQPQKSLGQPGICGLVNLRNTCFMNSVLQCMSNCPKITEYFLNESHLDELNETNPLGMRGEIAKAYGELIKAMWSGNYTTTNPYQFKVQVGKFNPNFCGYHQHDSQELLTFLLDGLHEDLNRIKSKPYIEIKDENGREDSIVAKEAWKNYLKRNDSIIVDTFHGLLKSHVVCPVCEKSSVTFDPFCYLSLPLPTKKERNITVRYIPYIGPKEYNCKLEVSRNGTIRDLCLEINRCISPYASQDCNPDHMIVAEMSSYHFHKFFSNRDPLESIEDKDTIFVFQLDSTSFDKNHAIFPVCFWELCSPDDPFQQNHSFGVPFMISVPRTSIPVPELHTIIFNKMKRHFSPFNNTESKLIMPSNDLDNDTERFNELPLKIFYHDTSLDDLAVAPLRSVDGYYDLTDIAGYTSRDAFLGRQTLLVQFTTSQRQEFYHEKLPDYVTWSSYSNYHHTEKGNINLRDCIRLFTTCEKLGANDAWYCPTCKAHQRATKKFDIWKLPEMLIIHLKRFCYNRSRHDKIGVLVDFPINDLDMSEYVMGTEPCAKTFELIGICNHYGNMGGGHYTAFCKNKDNKQWYCFDDNRVFPIDEDGLLTNAAYVLFYKAKETSLNNVASNLTGSGEEFMDIN